MQVFELVELPGLVEVRDVVVVHVKRLQVRQVEDVLLDRLQVVVGEIEPEQVDVRVANHHLLKHLWQSND